MKLILKVINLIGDLKMEATVGLGYIGHTSVNKIGRKVMGREVHPRSGLFMAEPYRFSHLTRNLLIVDHA